MEVAAETECSFQIIFWEFIGNKDICICALYVNVIITCKL